MIVLAHSSHWIESAMMGIPAVAFGVWLAIPTVRDHRAGRPSQGA